MEKALCVFAKSSQISKGKWDSLGGLFLGEGAMFRRNGKFGKEKGAMLGEVSWGRFAPLGKGPCRRGEQNGGSNNVP